MIATPSTIESALKKAAVKPQLDQEQDIICNLAWDFCTRHDRNEPISIQQYLDRPQLQDPVASEKFLTLVNMHKLVSVALISEAPTTPSFPQPSAYL